MSEEGTENRKREFNWPKVLYYIHLHAFGFYGLILLFTAAKWMTVFFTLFIISFSAIGIMVGAHQLWAHKAFETSSVVKYILMIAHTLAGVGKIYDWALAHKLHQKYLGTEKDPYNPKKGFLYSHVVSNLLSFHPDKKSIDKDIDMHVVESDRPVWVQRWLYWILFPILGLLLPINAPVEYWGESIINAIFILGFFRLAATTNISWSINSGLI